MTTHRTEKLKTATLAVLTAIALLIAILIPLISSAQDRVAPAGAPASAAASPADKNTAVPSTPQDALLKRGEYLARAGDCISCHTRPQGAPFAGGLAMNTPFGAIVSTNITPDTEQGIGQYTQEDFTRALREGKARDGHHLYPAMPYTNFARLTDDDLGAMYAYFMKGVQPVKQDNAKTDLPWPFSMRWLMAGWNKIYLKGKVYEPEPAQTAEWNRGAYLVQGLGHCGACHTPRSVLGGEKATTHEKGDLFLSGTIIDGWYAQPLRNTDDPGLATWSKQEIVEYLKTGRTNRTAAFGAMTEVVANSTQHMSREDLGAIATYLKSLGDNPGATTPVAANPNDITSAALRQGTVTQRGAMVYLNNCNACHRSDGQGAQRTFPTLAMSSTVAAKDPTSLIRIVLQGSAMAHTTEAPSQLAMPGFGWRLNDDNVADVVSFIRSSWGNKAEAVTASAVGKVRSDVAKAEKSAGAAVVKPATKP
ncbi:MAG: cytochrome c [Pseudomonadota bacterium]